MSGYVEYREVNLPWLKTVPAHWEIRRNKNIFTEQKEIVGERSADYTLLSLTLNGIIPRDMDGGGKFPESFDKYKIVKNGDMAFCLFDIDETPRTVGLSGYDGMLTGAYTIMRVSNINARFILYYYLALDNSKMLRPLYTGLRKTININTFQSTKVPVPPCEEQNQIVRFLDWKVSGINQLVATKRKQIKVLQEQEKRVISDSVLHGLHNEPLKDSNNRWIGKLPVSWKMIKLGKFCSFQNGISESGDFFTSGTPFVGYGDVYRHLELPEEVHGVAKSNAQQQEVFSVKEGDIFFTRTSENIEEVGMAAVCKHTIDKAVFSGFVIRCRPRTAIVDTDYMKYYLQIPAIRNHFSSMMNIVIRASLGQNLLKQMPVVIPPIDEQRKIAEYLDIEHAKYLYLISTIQKEINALQELKTCLISDVVTGKIDVRDIEIPEYEFVDEETYSESDGDEKSDESDAQED